MNPLASHSRVMKDAADEQMCDGIHATRLSRRELQENAQLQGDPMVESRPAGHAPRRIHVEIDVDEIGRPA